MIETKQTDEFAKWFIQQASDVQTKVTIRLVRIRNGLMGDCKPVGSGVSEARIDYGPGYRVYFKRRGNALIILLCGGDKKTQDRDIKRAIKLAKDY